MDAVVMCGGKGTRLESAEEKPLYPIGGIAMIDRVTRALRRSRAETVYAAVSPNASSTRAHLEDAPCVTTIETAGDGYVADLSTALDRPEIATPILTAAADLPLLDAPVIDRILAVGDADAHSRTICVPAALKRRLGVSVDSRRKPDDHLVPTGVNVVGTATDETMTDVRYDPRLAVNVNRLEDTRTATQLGDELGVW